MFNTSHIVKQNKWEKGIVSVCASTSLQLQGQRLQSNLLSNLPIKVCDMENVYN